MAIHSKKEWGWVVVVGIWVVGGLWLARSEFDLIPFLPLSGSLNAFDKRVYLFGSDYMAADYFLTDTPMDTQILALVPDPYNSAKLYYHIYPRGVEPVADPANLAKRAKERKYDYMMVYFPQQPYVWGFIVTDANMIKYKWTVDTVYQGAVSVVGEKVVGSLEQFAKQLEDNYGTIIYPLSEV